MEYFAKKNEKNTNQFYRSVYKNFRKYNLDDEKIFIDFVMSGLIIMIFFILSLSLSSIEEKKDG